MESGYPYLMLDVGFPLRIKGLVGKARSYHSNSSPYLSGDSFADLCDFNFQPPRFRRFFQRTKIEAAKTLFCPSHLLEDFLAIYGDRFTGHVLVIGNSDRDFENFEIPMPPSIKNVFIQNLGAGACTVTAGTATVATAGSLILPQNDAGILYFTATGASIFYDFIQVGAVSPLTTKGDLYTFSTSDARLAVGATNGMALTVDSAEATGLKYVGFVGASAYRNASQTISNATETALTFNSENYDTDAFHDNSTNNTRMTVPAGKAGKYLINANTTFTNNSTGQRIVYVYVGATLVHTSGPAIGGSASIDLGISTSYVANLAVADYVELKAYQNSGGSLAIYGNTDRSSFQVSYLGA